MNPMQLANTIITLQGDGTTRMQQGGTHYAYPIEPITFIEINKLSFSQGNVIKYVTRHKDEPSKEAGLKSLRKAADYLNRIARAEYGVDILTINIHQAETNETKAAGT